MTSRTTIVAPRILICVDWFAPGSQAGGPIRSIINLCELLGKNATLFVLTGTRDLNSRSVYPGVRIGAWNNWESRAAVWYATAFQQACLAFARSIIRVRPDVIYLNGMFSVFGAILPLLMRPFFPGTSFIVAPRGMLKPSALAIRRWKKNPWLTFLKWSGISRTIQFHATSDVEAAEIRSVFGPLSKIQVAPNVPRVPTVKCSLPEKVKGELRLSFLGRIHPIKNLDFVLNLLSDVDFRCTLDVIGPQEDLHYQSICEVLVQKLPQCVSVNFLGSLSNEQSLDVVRKSHVMILPTKGENFGHAIFEAMSVGVPVLISDQTFWRNLAPDKAGWDVSLEDPAAYSAILKQLAAMDSKELSVFQDGTFQRACRFIEESDLKTTYSAMFLQQQRRSPSKPDCL